MGANWILFISSISSPIASRLMPDCNISIINMITPFTDSEDSFMSASPRHVYSIETKVTCEVFQRLPTGPTSSRRSSTQSSWNEGKGTCEWKKTRCWRPNWLLKKALANAKDFQQQTVDRSEIVVLKEEVRALEKNFGRTLRALIVIFRFSGQTKTK